MFAKTTNVGFAQRVVATLVACAMVLWSVGAYSDAQAANLTFVSDTLSTSEPSVASSHTIAFTLPTGSAIVNGDTITIDFSDGPFGSVNTVVTGDVTVTVNGTPDAHANFAAGATSISFDSIAASAGQEVIVAIADGKITNPAGIQSYEIGVDTGTGGDTGKTRVAIVNTVLVTAVVQTTFDFTISGLATSTAVNGETTTGSTTDTQIPFGVLVASTPEVLGQRLNVTTNAQHGFVVTVEQDGNLRSANGADIDGFINGAYTNVPAAWPALTPNISQENTWGHWGLTSDDADLNTNEFGSSLFVAASTTPREIFSHNGPADGLTANMGSTTVGYKIEISGLQEAADDYSTTLTYIATPTF